MRGSLRGTLRGGFGIIRGRRGKTVGLVKTRRLAAMQKQQRAKAGMKPPLRCDARKGLPRQFAPGRRQGE